MIFVVVPWQIDSSGDYGLDPKFFPVALLWLITVMGGLLIATRLRQPADPPEAPAVLDRANWTFIAGATFFLVASFIAITALGYILAGILIIAVLMFVLELRRLRWLELAFTSVAAPVIIYLLLYHVFSVQLPAGSLFR